MKNLLFLVMLSGLLLGCNAQETQEVEANAEAEPEDSLVAYQPIDSDEALMATALMAAPEASREGVKVIGYNMAGEFVTFKEGNNEFICLVDNPKQKGFNAACYHHSLEPFMARGRELREAGKNANEIFDMREEEVKAGKLEMGETGATLHLYYGPESNYDPATGEVDQAQYRYVVYMPFATAASTGLPERPVEPHHPWIMNPGTHRAHIMITPLTEGE
ncbi:MAG: hypothetical protein RIC19_11090 [Phaeodactylibacter sp.]|uniref:hypothetical protein n=1 Tax=Phaeodactylibacter sp. TaxID=1940289 RepID=UPI0032ED937A